MALDKDPTFDPQLRATLFTGLTGRTDTNPGVDPDDILGMLRTVGGRSTRTHSGIDLTRAARALGVSRRTLERWVRTEQTGIGQRPSPGHRRTLQTRARQTATTRAGRRAALAPARASAAAVSRGAKLTISGMQGPISKDYMRDRLTYSDLTPEQLQAAFDAYERGGDKGFMAWVGGHWEDRGDGQPGYMEDWRFGQITRIGFEFPDGGGW